MPANISCIITTQPQPATSYTVIKLRMIPDPSTTVSKLGIKHNPHFLTAGMVLLNQFSSSPPGKPSSVRSEQWYRMISHHHSCSTDHGYSCTAPEIEVGFGLCAQVLLIRQYRESPTAVCIRYPQHCTRVSPENRRVTVAHYVKILLGQGICIK